MAVIAAPTKPRISNHRGGYHRSYPLFPVGAILRVAILKLSRWVPPHLQMHHRIKKPGYARLFASPFGAYVSLWPLWRISPLSFRPCRAWRVFPSWLSWRPWRVSRRLRSPASPAWTFWPWPEPRPHRPSGLPGPPAASLPWALYRRGGNRVSG